MTGEQLNSGLSHRCFCKCKKKRINEWSTAGGCSSPCRSVIVSALRRRSRLSPSSSSCSSLSCFSSSIPSLPSWSHFSFTSLRLTSRPWACFCASAWPFFSRAAASCSARSAALASSSCVRDAPWESGRLCGKMINRWNNKKTTPPHLSLQMDVLLSGDVGILVLLPKVL